MVEEYAVGGMHAVRLAVVDDDPVRILLGNDSRVWPVRRERLGYEIERDAGVVKPKVDRVGQRGCVEGSPLPAKIAVIVITRRFSCSVLSPMLRA